MKAIYYDTFFTELFLITEEIANSKITKENFAKCIYLTKDEILNIYNDKSIWKFLKFPFNISYDYDFYDFLQLFEYGHNWVGGTGSITTLNLVDLVLEE